ncbi:MAG TPA: fused MFS/spermidine synthase [Patescibacteria group bacterium]|nr:fused MFS/spermidine synthase [Patescibacteria group bacterium]
MAVPSNVVFEVDTEFGHYQVVDTIYEGRAARVLYSGGTTSRTAQSGVARDDNPDLLFDYNQRFLELLESVAAKRLLLIGGGTYTLPMALLQKFPGLQIDVAELDPGLQDVAERFFGLKTSPRLNIIHSDGRQYLEQNTLAYDVILVDAFMDAAIPESLSGPGVVKQVYKNLSSTGVAAMNIISPYFGSGAGIIQGQIASYRQHFKAVDVYPAGRATFSLWLPQNLVLVAQKGKTHEINLRYGKLPDIKSDKL